MPRRFAQFTEYEFLKDAASAGGVCVDRGDHHDPGSASVLLQSFLEHVQRKESQRQSLGSDNARVEHDFASATRQLCRRAADGLSRTYEFAVPGAPNDYVMQTDAGAEVTSGNGHNGHKH